MQSFVLFISLMLFLVYPPIGVLQKKLSLQFRIIDHRDSPVYFWSFILFLYYCGLVLPCILFKASFSNILIPLIPIFITTKIVLPLPLQLLMHQ